MRLILRLIIAFGLQKWFEMLSNYPPAQLFFLAKLAFFTRACYCFSASVAHIPSVFFQYSFQTSPSIISCVPKPRTRTLSVHDNEMITWWFWPGILSENSLKNPSVEMTIGCVNATTCQQKTSYLSTLFDIQCTFIWIRVCSTAFRRHSTWSALPIEAIGAFTPVTPGF